MPDPDPFLADLQGAATAVGACAAAAWLWEPGAEVLQIAAQVGLPEAYVAYGNQSAFLPDARRLAPVYRSHLAGVSVAVRRPDVSPRLPFRDWYRELGWAAIVTHPLRCADAAVGALALYFADGAEAAPEALTPALEVHVLRLGARAYHRAQAELAATLAAELEAANRAFRATLEARRTLERLKGEVLAAVSHELRTPLTAVVGYAELLEDGFVGKLDPRQAWCVGELQLGARRLRELADDLLDYAHIEAGRFTVQVRETDLGPVVAAALARVRPWADERGVGLRQALPAGPVPARADDLRIAQAVAALARLAINAAPEGTTVGAELVAAPAVVTVRLTVPPGGLDPGVRARLFDPSGPTQPASARRNGGTGLGPTVVKAIAAAHGGAVGVDEAAGGGSQFWLTLPA